MSDEGKTNAEAGGSRTDLRRVALDLWTGRRWVWAVLVAAAIAYLVFRGTPAVAFILDRLRDVCVTVILAIVLAYVVNPIVNGFCTLGPFCHGRTGRAFATLLVFLLLAIGLGCLLVLTADPIVREVARLYGLAETWLEDAPTQLRRLMAAYAAAVPSEIGDFVTERARAMASGALEYAGAFAVGAVLRGWYVVEALLVPVLAYYFVTDADQLRAALLRVLPDAWHGRTQSILRDVNGTLQGYVRGQLILCLIAGVVTSTVLYLLGVRVFLTLGILAGLARAVPVIGPLVTAVPIAAVAWIQVDARTAAVALALFAIMHFVESKVIMPKVLGLQATLHPVVVIVALLIGGEFFGIIGMFVAVPVAAICRILFLHWKEGRADAPAAPA
ncbi:MAG: AI-2E family transporter [Armatimonadetes bacterium]|nr:AI-2E family transporter [Armatimonadota bacterium]